LANEQLRQQKAQRLFLALQKRRVPAKFNPIDFSIGCSVEFEGICQALELLGWNHEHEPHEKRATMRNGVDVIIVSEPRPGWNPTIQILH
jgi:hypothetical protein